MFNTLSYYELAQQYRSPAALAKLTVNELRVIAKGRIVGRSKLRTKAMLVEAISNLLEDCWARIASEEEARKAQELEEMALARLEKERTLQHITDTDYLAAERKEVKEATAEGCGSSALLDRLNQMLEVARDTLSLYQDDMTEACKIARAQGVAMSRAHLRDGETVPIHTYTSLGHLLKTVAQDEESKDLYKVLAAFRLGYRDLVVKKKAIQNKKHEENTYKYMTGLVGIHKDVWIQGAIKVVENCDSIKFKKDAYGLLFAMGVLTGRRLYSELLHQANFVKIDGVDDHMHFTGQAKGKTINKRDIVYRIPVLAHPDIILKGFNKLKSLGMVDPNATTTRLTSRHSSKMSDAMGKILKDYEWTGIHMFEPRFSRGIYAAIITRLFKPAHMGENVFISRHLGHDNKDAKTANCYLKFYCED